jgi:hypothetical protein
LARSAFPTSGSPRARLGSILLYTLVVFAAGAVVHRAAFDAGLTTRLRTYGGHAVTYAKAKLRADPERLYIDIKHKHVLQLAHKREGALAAGLLFSSPDDFVPATIRHDDRSVRVKLRLKGDFPDHWSGDKWSFRIVVRGDDAIMRMKQFSIQDPRTRSYLYEWVLHEALRREDLPALRYDFVEVLINGKPKGVYALEEHFEKRLVEHSRRRDGPIIRFNEDLCFGEMAHSFDSRRGMTCILSGSGAYFAADVDAFHTSDLLADPAQREMYLKAAELLDLFRRGDLTTSEVFDVPQMARFFAVLELMGATHAAAWRNARFYYNPVTSRLEPIGFDGFGEAVHAPRFLAAHAPARAEAETADPDSANSLFASLFRDAAFFEEYVRQLERISAPGYLEDFLTEIRDDLDRLLLIIQSDVPSYRFSSGHFERNRAFILSALAPAKALHGFVENRSGGRVDLRVGNLQYLPLEILGVGLEADSPVEAVRLPPRAPSHPVAFRTLSYSLPALDPDDSRPQDPLWIRYRIPGSVRTHRAAAFPWAAADAAGPRAEVVRSAPNMHEFDCLRIDEEGRTVYFRPGTCELDRSLVVPAGYRLRAGPGTAILLENGALIVSHSRVEFLGSAEDPVVVGSRTGTGRGIVVIGAGDRSRLHNVRFENLAAPKAGSWELTGAVTFYESPVTMHRCEFRGARAEDALNLFRSEFEISDTVFRDSAFDALDVDFCDGSLDDTVFLRTGNDAVDFSGSTVRLTNLQVDGAGDKGLSAGEDSFIEAEGARIARVNVGVASKDLSRVSVRDVRVTDARYGFAAFRKKPEFGGGSMAISGFEIEAVDVPFLVEQGSIRDRSGRRTLPGGAGIRGDRRRPLRGGHRARRQGPAVRTRLIGREPGVVTSWRYERKFLIEDRTPEEVGLTVRFHPARFCPVYAPRFVNNVYFDSPGRRCLGESVDGISERVKYRVRWYGALFGRVGSPTLELKAKRGLMGAKQTYPLPGFLLERAARLDPPARLAATAAEVPGEVRERLGALDAVLLNRYRRSYFLSSDGEIRLTLDTELRYFNARSGRNSFLSACIDRGVTVVELKYGPDADERARWAASRFPFRMTKSSKYVRGVELLEPA